ncbi:hypothetical protein Pmani_025943 [Petrolisthes manimaculis]|uniref:Uncharacterized protein n=1 Tax=Petrolisthes manimaculis TaxID=1843537 RepID=A0AAE1P4J1_9EUCA|nr:hypothetical protein Pmani_025943 [Petrolisthes manimaculis]
MVSCEKLHVVQFSGVLRELWWWQSASPSPSLTARCRPLCKQAQLTSRAAASLHHTISPALDIVLSCLPSLGLIAKPYLSS